MLPKPAAPPLPRASSAPALSHSGTPLVPGIALQPEEYAVSFLHTVARACKRVLTAILRLVFVVLRIVFILCLVVLPVPIATLFIERPPRRNQPAQVLKKE
jgi:hypothetical protein